MVEAGAPLLPSDNGTSISSTQVAGPMIHNSAYYSNEPPHLHALYWFITLKAHCAGLRATKVKSRLPSEIFFLSWKLGFVLFKQAFRRKKTISNVRFFQVQIHSVLKAFTAVLKKNPTTSKVCDMNRSLTVLTDNNFWLIGILSKFSLNTNDKQNQAVQLHARLHINKFVCEVTAPMLSWKIREGKGRKRDFH